MPVMNPAHLHAREIEKEDKTGGKEMNGRLRIKLCVSTGMMAACKMESRNREVKVWRACGGRVGVFLRKAKTSSKSTM